MLARNRRGGRSAAGRIRLPPAHPLLLPLPPQLPRLLCLRRLCRNAPRLCPEATRVGGTQGTPASRVTSERALGGSFPGIVLKRAIRPRPLLTTLPSKGRPPRHARPRKKAAPRTFRSCDERPFSNPMAIGQPWRCARAQAADSQQPFGSLYAVVTHRLERGCTPCSASRCIERQQQGLRDPSFR